MKEKKDVVRYRCINFGACAKADGTEIIEFPSIDVLGGTPPCPCCKQNTLEEIVEHKSKWPLYVVAGVVAGVAIIIGCILAFSGGSSEQETPVLPPTDSTEVAKPDTVTVVKPDTVKQVDIVTVEKAVEKQVPVATKAKTSASSGNGTLRLSYGNYSGAIKNGYPHGQGRLTYTKSRQINRNDAKSRTANAGDYVIGEFYNGFVVYGKHYDSTGNFLGSLNFGVGNESSYDSK